jgi:dihydrodipicolinate synthase/N-acetylneuraminate lyase
MPSTEGGRFYMPQLTMQLLCLLSVVKYEHQHLRTSFLFVMHMLDNSFNTVFGIQLNNLELAVNLAKRANLPGAENLVSSTTYIL